MKKIIPLIVCVYLSYFMAAQITAEDSIRYLSRPGPKNQDTSKFASFYIWRPDNSVSKNLWIGVFIDDYMMVKMMNDMKCVVKCPKTGIMKVWSKNEQISSLDINAEAGKNYYIRMDIEPGLKTGYPKLVLIDEKEGSVMYEANKNPEFYIYDYFKEFKGPLRSQLSEYSRYPTVPTGFAEFLFISPASARHYFADAINGYRFMYNNKMLSTSFSEIDLVQRMGDKDFSDEEEFKEYVKKHVDKAGNDLKKSETLQEQAYEKLNSPADMTYAVYTTKTDTKPEGVDLKGQSFLETRTYQVCMYKKDVKKNKGRIFLISFSERGLPAELHSKEEIRFKINLLVQSSTFGKAGKTPLF